MTPADFDPYRGQITECACDLCCEVAYALSSSSDTDGRRHRAACVVLLDALRAGQHVHKTYAQLAAEARALVAADIEQGRPTVATVSARDFYVSGMGVGMTPGAYQRRRPPRGPWSPPRPDGRPAR